MTAMRFAASLLLGLLRLAVPVAIVVAAVIAGRALLAGRSAPERAADRAPQATAVETIAVGLEDRRSVLVAYGTVQPRRRITLRPEVGGRIVDLHPDLIAGGRLEAGATLLRIDPRQYEYRVQEQDAALVKAEFDLMVEEGRGAVARREWELLEDTVEHSELGARLARREPHLEERQAAVEAARSRLEMARLDLERTRLEVPFNAMVLEESVELGQLVNAQTSVATLIGTDAFHVRVSVPVDRLGLLSLPGPDGAGGSMARVSHETSAGPGGEPPLTGRVVRLLGDVDPAGRMARVLVEVADPLRDAVASDAPGSPLLVGEFVRVELEGPVRAQVAQLPRQALREGDVVWVMNAEDALEIRRVEVAWGTDVDVFISAGLADGDRIIVSPLSAPVPGMPLTDVAIDPSVAAGDAGEGDEVAPADDDSIRTRES